MKRTLHIAVFISLIIGLTKTIQAQETNDKKPAIDINGFVRNYTGVLFNSGDISILQNTLDLTIKHQRERFSMVANPYVYQYENQENKIGIRELYLDFYADKIDVRIGKQQIIWGQADGVFITDIVSPKNVSDFLLWDFNEIRIGVNAIKVNYYPSDSHDIEFVWIPTFTPTIAPENGSIWSPTIVAPVPVVLDYSQKEIKSSIQNSEFFMRYSIQKSSVDLQFIAGYTWDDDPSLHSTMEFDIDPVTLQPIATNLLVTPKHHRLSIAGINFSTSLKDFIIRGESAFYKNKYFQSTHPSATDALLKKDYLNYVLGVDRTFGDWKISGQFIQKRILNYHDSLQHDEVDNLVTLMLHRSLLRDSVRLELFNYYGLNNSDSFTRLRGYYFPIDGTSIEFGSIIFTGEKGTFGQYHKNDMIYAKLKYNF